MTKLSEASLVVGGVDTHKDLHVAAVVDNHDRVLGTESLPTIRHGYRLMLAWMRSFGDLQRIGIECSDSYGAELLRYMHAADVEVLEAPHLTRMIAVAGERAMTLTRKARPALPL